MAAPIGNQYAAKAKRWEQAISRALEKRSRAAQVEALDELAERLLAACDKGEPWALVELGNRLDGRPAQVIGGADDLPPIKQSITVDLVKANA